jgi:hypothetical protein
MPFFERNIVPTVSRDSNGRRRAVRVFTIYGSDIHSVVGNPRTIIADDGSGTNLPAVGDLWTPPGSDGMAPMRLDFYSAEQAANEIIATGHYSTDIDSRNLTLSVQNSVVSIPYAVKVPLGVIAGPTRGYAWQLSALQIITPMMRMSVSVRIPIEDVHAVSDLAINLQGRSYSFPETTAANAKIWRYEGSELVPLGPYGFECRYTFICDPGTRAAGFPASIPADQLARPDEDATVPGIAGTFVRPPFTSIVPLPPETDGQLPNPLMPKPPRFVVVGTTDVQDGPPPMYGTPLPIRIEP